MTAILTTWLVNYGLMTAGSTLAAFVLGWILKKIPTDKWAKSFENIGKSQGVAVTTFFNAKLPKLYNNIIEPIFIDTIDALILAWIRGFITGLKSDNKK